MGLRGKSWRDATVDVDLAVNIAEIRSCIIMLSRWSDLSHVIERSVVRSRTLGQRPRSAALLARRLISYIWTCEAIQPNALPARVILMLETPCVHLGKV